MNNLIQYLLDKKNIIFCGENISEKICHILKKNENHVDYTIIDCNNLKKRIILEKYTHNGTITSRLVNHTVLLIDIHLLQSPLDTLLQLAQNANNIIFATMPSKICLSEYVTSLLSEKYTIIWDMVSIAELRYNCSPDYESNLLSNWLLYGTSTRIDVPQQKKETSLYNLYDKILNRITQCKEIRRAEVIKELLRLLAINIGKEVSHHELSNVLDVDNETIASYIRLLTRAHITITLPSFHTYKSFEKKRSQKVYFFDNGIRNAALNNFSNIENRTDAAQLWENLMISERLKMNSIRQRHCSFGYWQNLQHKSVDYVEKCNDSIVAYDFKWGYRKSRIPTTFAKTYPEAQIHIVNTDTMWNFLNEEEDNKN